MGFEQVSASCDVLELCKLLEEADALEVGEELEDVSDVEVVDRSLVDVSMDDSDFG